MPLIYEVVNVVTAGELPFIRAVSVGRQVHACSFSVCWPFFHFFFLFILLYFFSQVVVQNTGGLVQGIMLLILVGFGECHPNSYNSLGWGH